MQRLLLLAVLGGCVLEGASTFTSCVSGATTVSPCGGSFAFPGGIAGAAVAGADASDNSIVATVAAYPFPALTGAQTISAAAVALVYGSSSVANSAVAQASAGGTYVSAGPARAGYIQFDVTLGQAHGGNADASLSDGTHTYNYDVLGSGSTTPTLCGIGECAWTAMAPFELGTDFTVGTAADVGESLAAGSLGVAHGAVDGVVEFRLLEADGTTLVDFSSVSSAPEPAAYGLVGLALGVIGVATRIRRSRRGGRR